MLGRWLRGVPSAGRPHARAATATTAAAPVIVHRIPSPPAATFIPVPRQADSTKPRAPSADTGSRLELDLNEETAAVRRQNRVRQARAGMRAACFVLLAIALVSGSRSALRQMFFDNPDYQIQSIRITTNGTLEADEITAAVQIREGHSLLRVNLQTVRAAVEALPQVQSASVTRTLPSELAIRIKERSPFARIVDPLDEDARGLVIDQHGIVLPESSIAGHQPPLARVLLPELELVEPGDRLSHPLLEPSIELLVLHSVRQQTFAEPLAIDGSKPYALHCLYPDGMEVLFRPRDLALQFHRLERIARAATSDQRDLAAVNLLAEDNLPVEFRPPASSADISASRSR